MPNKMQRQLMANAQVKGVQNFYKLKLGFTAPQMQVEQPSGMNFDTTPSYLKPSGGSNKPSGGK